MTEKQALRAEYRRLRRNYRQMTRRDYDKYLIPKDITRFIPDIPRIISDPTAFKNAAVSRLEGAIRHLERNIQGYRNYRSTFEKLDDAYLRRYEAEITNALLGINAFNQVAHQLRHDSNTVKMRARKIWNYLKSEISSNKRIRHFVAQRILKRWLYLVTDTARYIYGYFTDSGLAEQAFKKVIVDIFRPEDGEDGYFVSVWVNIADSIDMMDDGMDDLSDFY